VRKGDHVKAGQILAEMSALELTAAVVQAKAAYASAGASRDNVYAGIRVEERAALVEEIGKAKARLAYAELQLSRKEYLARDDTATQQDLDQAKNSRASALAYVAEAEANSAAAEAGPTKEERAIADAQVEAAAADLRVAESRLEKTVLRAPEDGIVTVVVGEVGEAVRAGQPILAIEVPNKRWLSFNVREDLLDGLNIGDRISVIKSGKAGDVPAVVTEVLPLGTFAVWQAERAVDAYDRNTLRLRLDLLGDRGGFEPGMTIWIAPRLGARAG
jgi:HlyD family secretion protein